MDLQPTAEQEAFRRDAREWLQANRPTSSLPSMDTADGFEAHRRWERQLHDAGWAVVNWPVEYGGRSADLACWLIFEEEYHALGCPGRVGQNGIFMMGPTLLEFGTDEQKERFLSPMARADHIWCQGWSEPDTGSDLAAVRTRAQRADGGFVVNGSKTWVSRGAFAGWMFALVRTGSDDERHRGLTFVVLPMDADGVTVRPIRQVDGKIGFAEVFLDDVFVPDDQVIGEPGSGWGIAMATAAFERGILLRSPGRFLATADRLVDLARAHPRGGALGVRSEVVDAWIRAQAYRLHTGWLLARYVAGDDLGATASLNKIFWSEMDLATHRTAMTLVGGLDAIDAHVEPGGAPRWVDGYLFSLAGPIYAGTNQIQRNIVADRMLLLPRT